MNGVQKVVSSNLTVPTIFSYLLKAKIQLAVMPATNVTPLTKFHFDLSGHFVRQIPNTIPQTNPPTCAATSALGESPYKIKRHVPAASPENRRGHETFRRRSDSTDCAAIKPSAPMTIPEAPSPRNQSGCVHNESRFPKIPATY